MVFLWTHPNRPISLLFWECQGWMQYSSWSLTRAEEHCQLPSPAEQLFGLQGHVDSSFPAFYPPESQSGISFQYKIFFLLEVRCKRSCTGTCNIGEILTCNQNLALQLDPVTVSDNKHTSKPEVQGTVKTRAGTTPFKVTLSGINSA